MEYICSYASPLGGITLASDGVALTGLWFDGQKYFADTLSPEYAVRELPIFTEAAKWLDVYFSGREPTFTPALHFNATPFRRAVWALLLTVPYGTTTTYGALAAQLAQQTGLPRVSAQAVGGAVSRNPISLIVPCHRVVGADGSLTGYAAGLDRKRKLLEAEGVFTKTLWTP